MPEYLIEWSDGSEMTQLRRIIADSREDAWQKSAMFIELERPGRNVVTAIYARPSDPLPSRILDRPQFGGGVDIIIEVDSAIERKLNLLIAQGETQNAKLDQIVRTQIGILSRLDAIEETLIEIQDEISATPKAATIKINLGTPVDKP